MSDPSTRRRFLRRYMLIICVLALVLALLLLGVIIVLDFTGSQAQPFQYLLH